MSQEPIENPWCGTVHGPNLKVVGQGLARFFKVPRTGRGQPPEEVVIDQIGVRLEGPVQVIQRIPVIPLQKIIVCPSEVTLGLVELRTRELGPHGGKGRSQKKSQHRHY